ncbi:cbb3-type cytochrome oxidase assembly protein CcoS [Pelistega europaea]|uniref:Cbb3-type cytochrome oxidase assembly protein CcoS n=1 Tax=Pelistega europaea TaxID=106147 RepID=A0A7Y4LC28_9BURK|nr:cbb3-type cytochrome oxidase assembly protein CcoS [Pelistega europaea]NOL49541.1 cbb3-type cytochrome oxidase assembly protein CcoS [Pelistega europaea]
MDGFFLLIALAVVFVIFIGVALYWAIVSGQFDDIQKNARSILEDDDSVNSEKHD